VAGFKGGLRVPGAEEANDAALEERALSTVGEKQMSVETKTFQRTNHSFRQAKFLGGSRREAVKESSETGK